MMEWTISTEANFSTLSLIFKKHFVVCGFVGVLVSLVVVIANVHVGEMKIVGLCTLQSMHGMVVVAVWVNVRKCWCGCMMEWTISPEANFFHFISDF